MKLLFPLQNLLRKVRSGAIALPEIEEPIRVELFPGVRENGGQYTHAAIWSVLAFAALGTADKAGEFFAISNPINHARTRAGVHRYKPLSRPLYPACVAGLSARLPLSLVALRHRCREPTRRCTGGFRLLSSMAHRWEAAACISNSPMTAQRTTCALSLGQRDPHSCSKLR